MTDLSPRLAALSAEQRAQLTRVLRERARREQAATIPRRSPYTDSAPCSWMQRGLWLLDQLQPNAAYNLVVLTRLRGRLDVAVLERALNEVIRRHEVLRTTFYAEDGEPMQRIAPELHVPIEVVDLSAVPADLRDAEAQRRATHEAQRPFDLARGPMVRPTLLQFTASDWRIIFAVHHIISDAWGVALLVSEVEALYAAFQEGRPLPLPELPIQYADYAVWQRKTHSQEVIDRDLEYWKQHLANAPSTELPTDKPRPPTRRFRGSRVRLRFPEALVEQLTALGRQEGATLYMVLLAAFQTLLHRYTGQDDVVVGSPMVDRSHAETHGLIGFFLNTLVLRTDLSGDPTFRELLQRVRRVALEAYEHQTAPFDQVVKTLQPARDPSRSPLFQIMFTFHDALLESVDLPGLELESDHIESGTAQFDLSLMLEQSRDTVTGTVEFDTDLFEPETIARLAEHLGVLLAGIAADPDQRLSALPLLTEAERRLVVEDWNQTARPYPAAATLASLFAEQAARTPEAVAVIDGDERLTYRELEARATQLAHHLRGLGVGPNQLVGVYLERSAELVVAVLGILAAGGAYVPLDPTYPAERLGWMAEDAGLGVVVSQRALEARVPTARARVVCVDGAAWGGVAAASAALLGTRAEDLAYVIYTSGSTGRPKGVAVPHGAVVNTLLWLQEAFPLTAEDTVAQKTAASFTDSVWELVWPLVAGAKLAIVADEAVRDPALLYRALVGHRVTVTQFVPPQLRAFLEWLAAEDGGAEDGAAEDGATEDGGAAGVADPLPALRWIFNGGEALPPELAQAWYGRVRRARIANLYGMTESAIYGTWAIVEPRPDGGVPEVLVGRPIANATAYVLDRWGQPCPPGVPGELHLGGRGLARGYLNQPELTAERFIRDPFSADPGARLYKTGDRGRALPDGRLEYLGRLDDQVKLRGYRVEPGEIEATLRAHPGVRDAAVVAREAGPGHTRLVAYVAPTAGGLPPTEALRAYLGERLPEYMVPSAFVALEALPLTPSGKLDRRALPAPDTDPAAVGMAYAAPRTPTEAQLAGIWAALLGVERVGIHDNFFALGGDSILSMRLVARARACGLELSPALLFQHQTIADLAPVVGTAPSAEPSEMVTGPLVELDGGQLEQVLAQLGDGAGAPLDSDALEDVYPLGPLQRGMLYACLATPDTTVYLEQVAWSFRGTLSLEAYRQAWQDTLDRHPILRTGFIWDGLDAPVQAVLRRATLPFRSADWRGIDDAEQQVRLAQLRDEERHTGLDLAAAPLMRLVVARLRDDVWTCVWTFHHLLLDGWSVSLLLAEVFGRYRAACTGQAPQLAPAAPYRDFIAWLRRQDPSEAERYWRAALRGLTAPTTLPVGSVDADAAEAARQPAEHLCWVSEETVAALQALARRERLTLNTILQGAWALLLSRYSGEEDVVFGATTSVRPPDLPDVEGMLGLLIHALPVRVRVPSDAMLVPWLQALQAQQVEARGYSYCPLADIQGWSDIPRTEPVFESLLIVENFPLDAVTQEAANLDLTVDDGRYATHSSLPLNLMVHPGPRLLLRFLYAPGRFDTATIARLAEHLGVLLAGIAADPERRLSELPLLTEAERRLVVEDWNQTARPYPAAATLASLFAEQAARTPEAVAVIDGDERLTYRELEARATQLAHHLRGLGVGPNQLVGVYLERSAELVVAVLGILAAGGAYVPLDPTYPAERLGWMAEDAGLGVVVSQRALEARVPTARARVVCVDGAAWGGVAAASAALLGTRAEDLAYVIYTSGSTGRPKGVAVPHGAVVNTLLWLQEAFPLTAEDTVAQKTAASFTDSVWELVWPLVAGAKLAIVADEAVRDPALLYRALVGHRVTVTQFVPPQLRAFLEWLAAEDGGAEDGAAEDGATEDGGAAGVADPLPALRWIFNGGEALPPELAQAWYGRVRRARIANLYGMTESAIYGTWAIVEPRPDGGVPEVLVGRPIANATAYVLDRWGQPCPPGVPGELHLGGRGLARGYLNQPELTAERFIRDPFSADPGARLYKTGDRGRALPDGRLEYLGRLDDQVKLRGYRVEPGEIEATLRAHPGVRDAAVVAREAGPGHTRLVAYVAPTAGGLPPTEALRAYLGERLPEYMVPSAFVALEALPLTPSGKLDRRALPAPDTDPAAVGMAYAAPRTPTEAQLAGIWAALLGVERVGIHDNFFALGGDSILSMRLVARARKEGLALQPAQLFQHSTIAELAPILGVTQPTRPVQAPTRARRPRFDDQQLGAILSQLDPGATPS